MNNYLFPPFMPSKQDGFVVNGEGRVYFNLSPLNSIDQVEHLQLSLYRQDNNRNLLTDRTYTSSGVSLNTRNSVLYYKKSEIKFSASKQMYYVVIPTLEAPLIPAGLVAKIQIRLGTQTLRFANGAVYDNSTGEEMTEVWNNTQINVLGMSEWSTISIIKTLSPFDSYIQNFNKGVVNNINTTVYTFVGMTNLYNSNPKETIKSTRFVLFDFKGNQLEDSGAIIQPESQKLYNYHTFNKVLDPDTTYQVLFEVSTSSGYTQSQLYDFAVVLEDRDITYSIELNENYYGMSSEEISLTKTMVRLVVKDTSYSDENLKPNTYLIRRASSKDNFETWIDLAELRCAIGTSELYATYNDIMVESGITYKYTVQPKMLNTSRLVVSDSVEATPVYEHTWLLGQNNAYLSIGFNLNLSNFKTVIKEAKIETIGSQYPFFVRNGDIKYREFSLSGLICQNMDATNSLKIGEYENRHIQERMFRDSLHELLLDGRPKLFKSETEGLILVYLSNVSLTPSNVLGRMLYDFSMTATEIGRVDVDNLSEAEIIQFLQPGRNIRMPAIVGYVNEYQEMVSVNQAITGVY
ncbi:MAG: hypothetical protein KIG63_02620 [Methanobrevibacter sp.]|nr:hypothetical protein [Methanobrevibacter sp.]